MLLLTGFLLLLHQEDDTAQLRYFIIDPGYRGIGIGRKLTGLFRKYLKLRGYKMCYLWTTHEQINAAEIYRKMGFILTGELESTAFGKPLTEQRYELTL